MPSIMQIWFLDLLSSNISWSQEIKVCLRKEKKGADAARSLVQHTRHDKEKPVTPFLPHQDKMYK